MRRLTCAGALVLLLYGGARAAGPSAVSPSDIRIFEQAQAALAGGRPEVALAHLAALAGRYPDWHRVQLDHAYALFATGRHEAADARFRALREIPDLPPVVRRNVERFLERIHAARPWQVDLGFSLRRDTNLNNAPEVDGTEGPGGFWYSQETPVEAWVLDTGARVRHRRPLSERWGIELSAGASRATARDAAEWTRTHLEAGAAPWWDYRWAALPGRVQPHVGVHRWWRGGAHERTATVLGVGVRQALPLAPWVASLSVSANPQREEGRRTIRSTRVRRALALSRAWGTTHLSFGVSGGRNRSAAPGVRYRSDGLFASIRFEPTPRIEATVRASVNAYRYEVRHLLGPKRRERTRTLSLTLSHRKLMWRGWLPELTIEDARTKANIALFARDNTTFRTGLRRVF